MPERSGSSYFLGDPPPDPGFLASLGAPSLVCPQEEGHTKPRAKRAPGLGDDRLIFLSYQPPGEGSLPSNLFGLCMKQSSKWHLYQYIAALGRLSLQLTSKRSSKNNAAQNLSADLIGRPMILRCLLLYNAPLILAHLRSSLALQSKVPFNPVVTENTRAGFAQWAETCCTVPPSPLISPAGGNNL
jgi:hypothetical protein